MIKMKKKIKIETIVLIILISVILISVVGVYTARQIKFRALESSLENYLITEQGYKKSDILSIKASHGKLPTYSVVVYFKDKPNVKYVFTDRNANEWTQLSPVP
ncbi:hypothetical protein D3C77_628840 [compost metagenome]